MKKMNLKKLVAFGCAAALTGSLVGCGAKADTSADTAVDNTAAESTDTAASGDTAEYNVAIVKQLDHASLDEIANAVAAELTGIDYVTGTSDALDTNKIMEMMLAQNPDLKNVGLLYSLSEANSTKPIADAKAYLDAKGIAYTEQTANTNDEVIAAASALVADKVDAIFTPTDNVIMAAELAIYEDLAKAGIPHYTGADSFVRNGAFATCGVNYTDLGTQTADLAYTAMTEGMDGLEDYYVTEGGIITVNTETAAALGIDVSVFDSLGSVTEVQTTED